MNITDVDLSKIYDLAGQLADIYRQSIRDEGVTASGTLEKFTYTIDFQNNSFQVVFNLPYYFYWIETGRQKTVKSGPGDVYKAIRKWIEVKPVIPRPMYTKGLKVNRCIVPTKDQLAYMITKKIHRVGFYGHNHQGKHLLEKSLEQGDSIIEEMVNEIGQQIMNIEILPQIMNIDK